MKGEPLAVLHLGATVRALAVAATNPPLIVIGDSGGKVRVL